DRQGDQVLALTRVDAGHRATSSLSDAAPERAPANTVARRWSNGQPSGTWARYSSRNRRMDETIGAAAASPSAQNDLPTTLSEMSSSSSRSSSVAVPSSRPRMTRSSQQVPSRHGVHLPQDSWA